MEASDSRALMLIHQPGSKFVRLICVPAGPNAMGRLSSGRLVVKGRVFPSTLRYDDNTQSPYSIDCVGSFSPDYLLSTSGSSHVEDGRLFTV